MAWKVIETHGNGVQLGNMEEEGVAKEKYLMRRGAVALAGASRVRRVSEPSDFGVASTIRGYFAQEVPDKLGPITRPLSLLCPSWSGRRRDTRRVYRLRRAMAIIIASD